jgi:hypothetical protein
LQSTPINSDLRSYPRTRYKELLYITDTEQNQFFPKSCSIPISFPLLPSQSHLHIQSLCAHVSSNPRADSSLGNHARPRDASADGQGGGGSQRLGRWRGDAKMAGKRMMEELSPESSRSGEHRLRQRRARGDWPACLPACYGCAGTERNRGRPTATAACAGRPPLVAGGARPYPR